MAISAISTGAVHAPSNAALSTLGQHKKSGRPYSVSDVDAQSSSVATPPSATGKVGSKLNITV